MNRYLQFRKREREISSFEKLIVLLAFCQTNGFIEDVDVVRVYPIGSHVVSFVGFGDVIGLHILATTPTAYKIWKFNNEVYCKDLSDVKAWLIAFSGKR